MQTENRLTICGWGPKQAIYRFRRADIDTYNRVKQLMEEHGGEFCN